MELEVPPEHITITPDGIGASRPPLDDGDNDSVTIQRHISARYINLLAQLNAVGQVGVAGGSSSGELLRDGVDEPGEVDVVSAQSHLSSQNHPYMPGFEQTADTFREEVGPMVTMADSSAYMSRPRRESSTTPDPVIWFGGKEPGYTAKDPSVISSAQGNHGTTSANKRSSYGYDDDPYAAYPQGLPTGSTSQILGSSSSEIGLVSSSGHKESSNSHKLSIEKQSGGISNSKEPTPPTSYSFRNRASSEPNSLRSILDRLRSGVRSSSPSPEPKSAPEVIVQDFATPPLSATRPTSPSLYINVGATRPPTPPSSLLRPMSPRTPNAPSRRPSLSTAFDSDRLWPTLGQLTLPPLPSPAVSEHSEEVVAEGLLDPRLPWRLEQARFDSNASLRDHEDYSRPIGGTVRYFPFDVSLI